MLISEIISLLHADILTAPDHFDTDIQNAFSSDMMSDVLAYANDHTMLITGLTNPQAIRTAEMLDIDCILYIRGKQPDCNTITMAHTRGITILSTRQTMFNTCGILYEAGLRGGMIKNGK